MQNFRILSVMVLIFHCWYQKNVLQHVILVKTDPFGWKLQKAVVQIGLANFSKVHWEYHISYKYERMSRSFSEMVLVLMLFNIFYNFVHLSGRGPKNDWRKYYHTQNFNSFVNSLLTNIPTNQPDRRKLVRNLVISNYIYTRL